jgi:hypothetical protein
MTIRQLVPRLSTEDKRLLELVDHLLSSAEAQEGRANQAPGTVLLSDKEAAELAMHFERLLQSREFLEAIYFVDQIYGRSDVDLNVLKSIFVRGTKRYGRGANIHSTLKWHQFLTRLGAARIQAYWPPHRDVQPMSFDHFLRMERRLLEHFRFSVKTRELLMVIAAHGRDTHEHLRDFDFTKIHGERLDRPHEVGVSVVRRVRERAKVIFGDAMKREPSAQQLAGLTTLVTNLSVMFTSRDWGVAGTISTMCGAIPLAVIKPRR